MRYGKLMWLAAALLSGAAVHAETLKLTHQWPQGDGRDRGARLFVQEVVKHDPSFKFRIYPGASLISNPLKQIDALASGSIDLSIFPLIYGVGKAPEFSITILPGAINSVQDAMRFKGTAYEKRLQAVAEKQGFHILTWWWTEGGIADRVRPITTPDSVKGLKFRGADRTIDTMLKQAGASVFSMPSTELYNAMQTGVLDGLMTSYETFMSMRLYEQSKYATLGGKYTIFVVFQPLVISTKAWNRLTAQQKKIFEAAADATQASFNAEQDRIKAEVVKKFESAGVKVHQMTQPEYQQWLALAKKTAWPEYASISPQAKGLLQAVQELNKQ
ncbi:TRAP transporter substrate-binding protein DctP [Candidimonas humi]|uniref:TRAP transporter substrate-binding protein DctP n=1 Tax=Candidimonas humi TaxID=683355 RepID=A0ABV8NU40_9BURK|nr:TRAP transporter substrate-binding protein DctP [Candidimonas humi]MBV6303390.1 TRAP transporter substrate-binding protein DctP [Candidimonas humi]